MDLKKEFHFIRFQSSSGVPEAGQPSSDSNEQDIVKEKKGPTALRCPICGFENSEEAEVCAQCGQRLKPARVASPRVGGPPETEFGFPQERQVKSAPPSPWELPSAEALGEPSADAGEPAVVSPKRGQGEDIDASKVFSAGEDAIQPDTQPFEIHYYFGSSVSPPQVLVPSGFFARASAFLIDFAILMLLGSILANLLGAQSVLTEYQQKAIEVGILNASALQEKYPELASAVLRFFSYFFALIVGYFGIFSALGGQTIGKAVSGIRLAKADGGNVGIFVSFARAFVVWFLINFTAGMYLILSAFVVMIDRRGRAPHDHLFGTLVVRGR